MKLPFVYLMASKRSGTLYVGLTSDLANCNNYLAFGVHDLTTNGLYLDRSP